MLWLKLLLDKPDSGYEYEGPIEDMPRNISPADSYCRLAGSNDHSYFY